MATWRSENLPWIVLGSIVALMAAWRVANPPATEQQNFYASREACERDYDPSQCRQSTTGASGYYGPRYFASERTANDPGPGRTALNGQSQAATHVARGGFGSTGRGHSGGYG